MKRAYAALSGAFLAGVVATFVFGGVTSAPASAANADRACLQNNRIWSWQVIDDRTLVVSDRQNRPFLVRLTGGCLGLNRGVTALRFRTWTDLGCLGQGDRVSFFDRALGPMFCMVSNVSPYRGGRQYRRGDGYDGRYDNDRRDRYDRDYGDGRDDRGGEFYGR